MRRVRVQIPNSAPIFFGVIQKRSDSYLARYFTGEAASSQSDEAVRVPGTIAPQFLFSRLPSLCHPDRSLRSGGTPDCLALIGRGRRIVFDASGEGPNSEFQMNQNETAGN